LLTLLRRPPAAGAIALALLAFPASAQLPPPTLVIERLGTGVPTSYWTTSSGVNAEYVSWSMPAGIQYTNVGVNIRAHGQGGTGTGTAYLYSAPGTSGTLTAGATLVATTGVSVPASVPAGYFTPTGLFGNVTLSGGYSAPVTYYLLLVPSNASLAWDVDNASTTTAPPGVTVNPDEGTAVGVASPPSASTWSTLSPNGMLFELFSFTPPSSVPAPVPALSPWSLFGAALLLGACGCWLLAKRRVRAMTTRADSLLAAALLCQIALAQTPPHASFAASRVLVKFRNASLPADVVGAYDVAVARPVGGVGAYLMQSRSQSTAALISGLKARSDVLLAAPDYIIQPANTPNDPLFGQQWGLPQISAPSAWNYTTGSRSSVVGVLDTGVDYTHPDLQSNMWSAPYAFTVTIASQPLTCPAGSHGFSSITDTSGNLTLSCDPQEGPPSGNFYGHGTEVAGVVGAIGDNGIGVAGVNWTASVMGLRMAGNPNLPACPGGFCGYLSDALNAIEFAIQAELQFGAQANIRILSASWGWNQSLYGCGFLDCTDAPQILSDEISRANGYNMLFVAAAGNGTDNNLIPIDNDTSPNPTYPATLSNSNIISVAATDQADALSNFSDYGAATVHLGAPGGDLYSGTCYGGIRSTFPDANYQFNCGTSLATPFVSGAAALVLSICPDLDTAGLKAVLLDYVDDDAALHGYTVTGGRLNVSNAVQSCSAAGLTSFGYTSGAHLYEATNQITAGSTTGGGFVVDASVNPAVSVSFVAGSTIYLMPYFHVKAGATGTVFHASINPQIR
jgi:subtilisin family serine protease